MAQNQTISMTDLQAQLAMLKAENEQLKLQKQNARYANVGMKIGEKGGLSVYGLGRFPVTLYKQQWVKLLSMKGEIERFMAENADRLTEKE